MSPPTDATLLLRVHAEHEWLQDELASVLDELETPAELGVDELQAALAYLEVSWLEGRARAEQTDAAYERWERQRQVADDALGLAARSYYGWLLILRAALAIRVEPFSGFATGAALRSL